MSAQLIETKAEWAVSTPGKVIVEALASLSQQEKDLVFTNGFDQDVAFAIGQSIKSRFANDMSALVSVRLFSGLTLFQTAVGQGVQADNEEWVQRKLNTVRKFGKSSFLVGRELVAKGKDINSLPAEFAAHGGAFPIRLKSCPYPIGAVIVSGLPQWQDHAVVTKAIAEHC